MKTAITIIGFLFALSVQAGDVHQEGELSFIVREIVDDIAEINRVMGFAVGYAGRTPGQYGNFKRLQAAASKDELIYLTQHANTTVRCYAFWALSYDSTADLFPIVKDHITDYDLVETQFGCIVDQCYVGDFFLSVASGNIDHIGHPLSFEQLRQLDTILLTTPNNLSAKYGAIDRVELTEDTYPTIREFVVRETNETALVALAKYQKKTDIPVILNFPEDDGHFYTYRAISHFPDPEFFPFLATNLVETLDDTHFSNEWAELYNAIAGYKDEKAVELLHIPLTQVKHSSMREYHLKYLYDAVSKLKAPIYDELLWKLWAEENMITLDIFYYLRLLDDDKAWALTKKSLQNVSELYSYELLVSEMLELALKRDADFAYNILKQYLEGTTVHLYGIFARKASEIQDPSFIEPLFRNLETETNPNVYLEAADALFAYGDPDIRKRIVATLDKNEALTTDWGGEALAEMIEDKK